MPEAEEGAEYEAGVERGFPSLLEAGELETTSSGVGTRPAVDASEQEHA
ncbi:hypothetical protein [Polyangium sorediatum]|uniref:Uncharacterized protein n=1 Tax=Polyangium sorediatum TaxID=889274 RepID=A0ABT6P3F1_9BACT|nr:hypothetical protein [Polyangium sorediatum]MDI1435134.1 hypothetical protein [Polyangium sorediatum]